MQDSLDSIFGFSKLGILQNRHVPKKNFYDHGDLTGAKKKLFTESIDRLRIIAICDKNTINIEPYVSEERMYKEIFFLHVDMKDKTKSKSVTEIIHQTIPNPVVIICSYENDMLISVAPKRLSQQEKGQIVVEDQFNSIWVDLEGANEVEEKFLKRLFLKNFRFDNLHVFYSDIAKAVIYSSFIEVINDYLNDNKRDIESVTDIFKELKKTQESILFHTNEDKRLKNFGDKVANHQKLLDAQAEWDILKQTVINL